MYKFIIGLVLRYPQPTGKVQPNSYVHHKICVLVCPFCGMSSFYVMAFLIFSDLALFIKTCPLVFFVLFAE